MANRQAMPTFCCEGPWASLSEAQVATPFWTSRPEGFELVIPPRSSRFLLMHQTWGLQTRCHCGDVCFATQQGSPNSPGLVALKVLCAMLTASTEVSTSSNERQLGQSLGLPIIVLHYRSRSPRPDVACPQMQCSQGKSANWLCNFGRCSGSRGQRSPGTSLGA